MSDTKTPTTNKSSRKTSKLICLQEHREIIKNCKTHKYLPSRLKSAGIIYSALDKFSMTARELCAVTQLSLQTIKKTLSELKEVDLIKSEKVYVLSPPRTVYFIK